MDANLILAHSGYYNKIAETGSYFLWFWRLGSPSSKSWKILCLVKACILGHWWWLLAVSSHGVKDISGVFSLRILIPFMKWWLHLHDLNTFQRLHFIILSALGVRISTYDFGEGDTNIQTVAKSRVTKPQRHIGVVIELRHEKVIIVSPAHLE